MANDQRKEGVEEHKGSTKTGIRDYCEQSPEQIDFWHHWEEEHSGHCASDRKA